MLRPGFEGKPKGTKQILFETGWYRPELNPRTGRPLWIGDINPQKDVDKRDHSYIGSITLKKRPDFAAEKTDLEKFMLSRGHILIMSPKCHPELAGHGIEYSWGAAKLHYRRNNTLVPRQFRSNVDEALAILTRRHVFMFERRARSYRNALKDPANSTFQKIETCVKVYKAHRNAVDFDSAFIKSVVAGEPSAWWR